jgi:hypothetical protein
MTPPPNEDKENKETYRLKAQAHHNLESNGCPACYPLHLKAPVRDPPEECRPIIEYWKSFSSTGNIVLCI